MSGHKIPRRPAPHFRPKGEEAAFLSRLFETDLRSSQFLEKLN